MKRILVTGSQGYIGSMLTGYLEEKGFDCVGCDAGFFSGNLLYDPPPTKTARRDARDLTEADLKHVDVVVHLAGISNDPLGTLDAASIYDPTRAYSRGIAQLCKKLGVRFVFASSCSVYGLGDQGLLTEGSPTYPQTLYSLNKLQIEEDLSAMSGRDFSPIALRFATVFGPSPRIRFDVVVNMLTGMAVSNGTIVLNSDGSSWRPNVHILDVCKAVRCAIDSDYRLGELLILNVGSDVNNLQVIKIATIIQQAVPGCALRFLTEDPGLDKEGLIRDRKIKAGGDTRTYKVSFEKIRTALPGFECDWTVERGVQEMAARFKKLPLSTEIFKRRGFYRLQELEYLHDKGYLSDDLRWLKPDADQPGPGGAGEAGTTILDSQIPQLAAREIDDGLLQARTSVRQRHAKVLHATGADFNRVFNFILQDSYMQPHLHPGAEKIERIALVEGKMAVIFFDDGGVIKEVVALEKGKQEFVDVPAFAWHTYVMLTGRVISYETMMGVYDPGTWKEPAKWAPVEGTPRSVAYLKTLKKEALNRIAAADSRASSRTWTSARADERSE